MPSESQALSRKLNLKRVALDGLVERELLDDEAKPPGHRGDRQGGHRSAVRRLHPGQRPGGGSAPGRGTILQEMYQSYAARRHRLSRSVAQARFNARDTAIPVDFRDPKTKVFDMKVYERQVRNLSNRSTTEFREEQARELLASKVRDVVRDPIRISEAEAWDEYDRRYSTATLTYVPVKESWAARWGVDVDPGDVDAWLKDHQADFDKALEDRKKRRRAQGRSHPPHPGEAALRRDRRREGRRAREAVVGGGPHPGRRALRRGRARRVRRSGQRPDGRRRGRQDRRLRDAVQGRRQRSAARRGHRGRRRDAVRLPLHHARRSRPDRRGRRRAQEVARALHARQGQGHRDRAGDRHAASPPPCARAPRRTTPSRRPPPAT